MFSNLRRYAALFGFAILGFAPAPIVTAPAQAQTDGESRCGADGYVERFENPSYGSPHWRQTMMRCSNGGGSYNNGGGNGGPADGSSRCGADGYVERFENPSYGSPHWRQNHAALQVNAAGASFPSGLGASTSHPSDHATAG